MMCSTWKVAPWSNWCILQYSQRLPARRSTARSVSIDRLIEVLCREPASRRLGSGPWSRSVPPMLPIVRALRQTESPRCCDPSGAAKTDRRGAETDAPPRLQPTQRELLLPPALCHCSLMRYFNIIIALIHGRNVLSVGVNASLLILLKNPYWSPFDPQWCSKNAGDSGRMRGFSAESTFDRLFRWCCRDAERGVPGRPPFRVRCIRDELWTIESDTGTSARFKGVEPARAARSESQ